MASNAQASSSSSSNTTGIAMECLWIVECRRAGKITTTDTSLLLFKLLPGEDNAGRGLPSLDRLPDVLAPWRALNHRVFLDFLRSIREKVACGELVADNAFATRLWEGREQFAMDELDVAYLAGTMFEAGTDTTAAAISTFVLTAISYPKSFKTAQGEVVSVCGDNPPTMAKFEQCEYVRAMCKETLRWRTVTAGGLPHMATMTEDESYHGMRIPAGAILIPNDWGMCFNPQTYGQKYYPQLFELRHWIDRPGGVGELWKGHAAFGFGRWYIDSFLSRSFYLCSSHFHLPSVDQLTMTLVPLRICPGRYLAAQSIFLVLANLCYSFEVVKANEGVVVDTYAYTTGFNIEPEHFKCSITPRPGIATAIEREADAARDALKHL
ncbi:cytochrome P450 [Gautieria morchelliformis]|nr:cytochrome P450 [Gautieria morchelliformis]